MPPDDLTRLGMHGKARIGAGHGCAGRIALRFGCRRHAARAVIDEIELGIVAEVAPDAGVPAVLEAGPGPGLVAGLAWMRNQFFPPQLLAVARVVAGNITAAI